MSVVFPSVVDNVTKNIINEISRECSNIEIHVSDDLITYLVHLLALNPRWGLAEERTRDKVAEFVKHAVFILCKETSPVLITLKMQLYFNFYYASREELLKSKEMTLKTQLAPLKKDIIDFKILCSDDEHRLYNKIIVYSTLFSGLGDPSEVSVYVEVQAALSSVFPISDANGYVQVSKKDKDQQLQDMAELVMGIRLFNRDCQRSGEGIEDLPSILNTAVESNNERFENILLTIMERVNTLTTAIDACYKIKENHYEDVEVSLPDGISHTFLKHVIDLLVVSRQHEIFARKLLADLNVTKNNSQNLFKRLQQSLLKLHDIVRFRTAIPIAQVFPYFIEIARLWIHLQNEIFLITQYSNIASNLNVLCENLPFDNPKIFKMIKGNPILTDAQRLEATTGLIIPTENNKCKVLSPNQVVDFDLIPLKYLGFCAWSIVATKGALIPGNPNMGVCEWKSEYYVFANLKAAALFGSDPERYMNEARDIIRKKLQLINLLHMYEDLKAVRTVGKLYEKPKVLIEKNDVEMQTELHPIPTFIDLSYSSNVWDWKRHAIKMTNVAQSQTHSTQSIHKTVHSHFRHSLGTQTYEPKDKCLQTSTDNSTNVPKLQNFIFGLRGRKDDVQHVIELTRPVQE